MAIDYIQQPDGSWKPTMAATATLTRDAGVFNLTDMGNAERLAKYYGDRLHYCYEPKSWLIWNGKVWEWDTGAKITVLAKLTVRNIYHEAANEPDEKKRKELADHAKHSESDHRINAMISLAQSEPGIPIKVTELDTDPWLFNCMNGTIDLHTGQLLPHHKEDRLTVIVSTEYHPDAPCPRWFSFLERVTDQNHDLITYLQRAVGYSLTGDTKSQVMFLLYGLGNNGKSTFTMTIRKLMAAYGQRLDADDIMLKDGKLAGGPKEGIADLRNKRYVVTSELQDGKRLDVSRIKDMTGGETIKGRRLYEHEFEFMPTFKLWLYGNHKPVIADTTLAIWRRVKQIPFTVTIPVAEMDPDLPVKLEAELPGILAWAVKGCLDWQQYGLIEPEIVTTATANYRHEQDILGDFIDDCCVLEPLATISKADLKDEYQRWCQDNNIEPVTQRTFKARLIEKGIGEGRMGKARYWRGIRLRIEADSDLSGDKSDKTFDDLHTKVTKGNHFAVNPLYIEKQKDFIAKPVKDVTNVTKDNDDISEDTPLYPTAPCQCGCKDFWLGPGNQWLCSQCHPKAKER
jgi:putative DNA primase/helicase